MFGLSQQNFKWKKKQKKDSLKWYHYKKIVFFHFKSSSKIPKPQNLGRPSGCWLSCLLWCETYLTRNAANEPAGPGPKFSGWVFSLSLAGWVWVSMSPTWTQWFTCSLPGPGWALSLLSSSWDAALAAAAAPGSAIATHQQTGNYLFYLWKSCFT